MRARRGSNSIAVDGQAPTTIKEPAVPTRLLHPHRRVTLEPRRHTDFERALHFPPLPLIDGHQNDELAPCRWASLSRQQADPRSRSPVGEKDTSFGNARFGAIR